MLLLVFAAVALGDSVLRESVRAHQAEDNQAAILPKTSSIPFFPSYWKERAARKRRELAAFMKHVEAEQEMAILFGMADEMVEDGHSAPLDDLLPPHMRAAGRNAPRRGATMRLDLAGLKQAVRLLPHPVSGLKQDFEDLAVDGEVVKVLRDDLAVNAVDCEVLRTGLIMNNVPQAHLQPARDQTFASGQKVAIVGAKREELKGVTGIVTGPHARRTHNGQAYYVDLYYAGEPLGQHTAVAAAKLVPLPEHLWAGAPGRNGRGEAEGAGQVASDGGVVVRRLADVRPEDVANVARAQERK